MVAAGRNEKFKWHKARRSRASCRAVFIKYKWDALLQLYEESAPSAPLLSGTSLFMMLFTASAHVMFYIFHFFQLENNAGDLVRDYFPLPKGWLLFQIKKEICCCFFKNTFVRCHFEFGRKLRKHGSLIMTTRPQEPDLFIWLCLHAQTCTRTAQ